MKMNDKLLHCPTHRGIQRLQNSKGPPDRQSGGSYKQKAFSPCRQNESALATHENRQQCSNDMECAAQASASNSVGIWFDSFVNCEAI